MGTPRMVPVYTDQELKRELAAAVEAADTDRAEALVAIRDYRVKIRKRSVRLIGPDE